MIKASPCLICGHPCEVAFEPLILRRHKSTALFCRNCGFLRLANPVWLAEAYSDAITATDTGLVARNVDIARKLSSLLFGVFLDRGENVYVDVAGGYGMLTRLMRDYGFNFYWSDLYCQNLLARGFDYKSLKSTLRAVDAITAVEVVEHLENPLHFIESTLSETGASTFIFTTELFEGQPPDSTWWYYSFDSGQHIAFFQLKTLQVMAEKMGMFFLSANGVHIFSKKPVSKMAVKLWTSRFGSKLMQFRARRKLPSRTNHDHNAMRSLLGQNNVS